MRKKTERKDQAKPSAETRRRRRVDQMERDQMKCAVLLKSVHVRTSIYQYHDVPVCTCNELNLSCFEIRPCHIVSHA